MLLLYAPDPAGGAVPGPRRAAGAVGVQFLPQPGLELHRMQLAERRKAGGRFSPPPLPRAPLDRHRTRRPPARPRRPRLGQTPPSPSAVGPSHVSPARERWVLKHPGSSGALIDPEMSSGTPR